MNHIYKSIFNKALGVFTAVPEFASAHGKGSERTVVGRVAKGTAGFAASALAISVGLALTSTSAVAGPGIYINDGTDTGCLAIPDVQGPNVGIHGISGGVVQPALSLLGPSQVVPDKSYYGLGVMKPCLSSISANAVEERSTQTNRTLFYGKNGPTSVNDNGAKNLTLGGRLDVNSGIIGVGDRGTNGAGATNSIRMGTGTTLDDANKKINSIAIGVNTGVNTADSIAIGDGAKAGKTDKFSGERSVAVGYNAQALGTSGIAIGEEASTTNGHNSIAIGAYSKTNNEKAISIGAFSTASGVQSIVMAGNYDSNSSGPVSVASGTRATVIGAETTVSGNNSVAIGDKNTVASNRTYAIGNNINVAAGANDSLVFGTKAAVGEAEAIALGKTANSKTEGAISIGAYAVSGDGDPVPGAADIGKKSISIGYQSVANRYNTIAMGIQASTQAADSAVAPLDAVAIGSMSKATTYKALAIGAYSQATGRQSTVIGNDINGHNSTASGTRSQILGVQSNVSGDNSVSIGDTNTIASARTYALGNNINVKAGADDSLAFGTRAAVGAANTVAIGANANAAQANSVALGAGSATDAPHTGDYTLNNSYTAAGSPVAANGAVSVGSKGKERQIQNVAAGVISATSTDAINGSQLYETNEYLTNFAGGVKNVLGGDAAVDDAGNVTMSNIGGTGKGTVHDAIKSLKDSINAKADTTASVTSENAADIKVEKEDPVGNITNYKLSLGDDAKAKLAKAATALQTVEGDSNITVTKDTTDPTKVKLALNKDLTVDSLTLGDTAGNHAVVNKDGLTIANGPSVKKDGINAGNKKITGVADGNVAAGSKDAVNGGQLAEVKAKADSAVQNVVSANPTALTVTKAGDTVTLTPNFIAGDLVNPATGEVNTPAADDAGKLVTAGTVAKALAETHFVVDTKATTGGELDGASQANQKIKSSNKVTLQAGKNLKAKQTNGTDGAQVEFSLKDSISLTQVTAGTGDNQVVLGKDGVQVGGNTYINKDGINAAGKAISNVANGNVAADSKDAVNGGQLHETAKSVADVIGGGATVKDGKVVAGQNGIGNTGQNTVHGAIAAINQNTANNFNQIRGDLRKMDRDLRGGIAGALATAGLPQAFRPGKSMVAAAASTYRGQSGLAIGVSRISDNGKVILKVTGNTNSRGDFGGTIGAGYQW